MMIKVIIRKINNFDYTLVDESGITYTINIEFYSNYKPVVGDIIYLSKEILINKNLYSFDEVYNTNNIDIIDVIKVVHQDNSYYFQRIYG